MYSICKKGGIEQYQYLGKGTANAIVPVLHFQNSKGWYAEARYNYDENNTFSLLGGRSFQLDKNGFSSIVPMIGFSLIHRASILFLQILHTKISSLIGVRLVFNQRIGFLVD